MASQGMEFHNLRVRRRWSQERRDRDLARRVRLRVKFMQYTPVKYRPEDTLVNVREEREFIRTLREHDGWINLWELLNLLTHKRGGAVYDTRPQRQMLLALTQRLINEKRIVRHRKTNTICLIG